MDCGMYSTKPEREDRQLYQCILDLQNVRHTLLFASGVIVKEFVVGMRLGAGTMGT